ncbi:MAG: hypothetical protein HKN09_09215 [Saprospiraceae bacterium]|nr:hypothetical protein [Saprospiraceae bacterium]
MISDIIRSFNAYGRSVNYLFKPWSIKYVIASGLLSLLTLVAFILVIYFYGDNLIDSLFLALTPKALSIEWLVVVFEWLTRILLWLGLIFIFKYIVLIITAPIMSLLSESVEIHLTSNTIPQLGFKDQIKSMVRGTRLALSNVVREILITIPTLLLSFIPGFALFTTPFLLVVQSYYAGFGNFDFFMERRYNIRESRIFMNRHRGLAIGNGFLFLSFLLVPIVGVLLSPPLSTIAATVASLDLMDND